MKKISNLFVARNKEIGKKKPETNILQNLNFTSAIKLLWGTLIGYSVTNTDVSKLRLSLLRMYIES